MLILLSLACSTGAAPGGDTGDTLAELDAELEGYESWGQLADWEGVVPSDDGTHGSHVEIWLNDAAMDTIDAAAGDDMPDGAILAKQGYNDADGTDLGNLTVMYKTGGEWFWASWAADGSLNMAGDLSGCTGCHSSGQDMVRVTTW